MANHRPNDPPFTSSQRPTDQATNFGQVSHSTSSLRKRYLPRSRHGVGVAIHTAPQVTVGYQTSFLHSSEWTHHQTIKFWPWKETHHFKMKQDHKIICLVVSDHWNTCPLLKHPFLGIKKHQWHQLSIGSCSVHVKMILNHYSKSF